MVTGRHWLTAKPRRSRGVANVRPAAEVALWADNISHGELLREGFDESLTVDPSNLRLLFQGAWEKQKAIGYGAMPWRIGILSPASLR